MIKKSSFKPTLFLKNPHFQTIWPRFFNPKKNYHSERLELPDGDFIDLSWTQKTKDNQPIVIILHGLEGCILSPYIQGILKSIENNGWVGVLMHFRTCSGVMNRLDRNYHSGDTEDIRYCIEQLQDRYPANPLYAVGYSLGGNVLLKYMGEQQELCQLRAAIAVSVPFELNRGADKLNRGFSKLYQWYLINLLHKKMTAKFKHRKAPINVSALNSYKTFWLFDQHITAPLHGFASAEEYYTKSSCRPFISSIKTPTLIIHAKDDPFLPDDAIPKEQELSQDVTLELTEHGGHVGFIAGHNPFQPVFWLEQRIPEFIHEQLTKTI